MADTVLVTGMQRGYLTDSIRPLTADIADFLDHTSLDPVFARFVNEPGSSFETTLGWTEMREPEDIALVDTLSSFATPRTTFDHHTYSALTAPSLQQFLDGRDGPLFLCGVDTDATILDTAFHAFNTGHDIRVIRDLCASRGGEDLHDAAIRIMERTIGRVVVADEL